MQSVMGVMITHNHTDHIKGLYQLTKRNNLPVFTTQKIWKSILSPVTPVSKDCIRVISLQEQFNVAGFSIEAFPVYHDAPETVGYHICVADKKITILTDLGHICATAASYIKAANLLVIESNYDEEMLTNGSYPAYLKNRIKSETGHLANHHTAAFLAENIGDHLTHICLAHLSKNNNTPFLALEAFNKAMSKKGIELKEYQSITVLNRDIPSTLIRF